MADTGNQMVYAVATLIEQLRAKNVLGSDDVQAMAERLERWRKAEHTPEQADAVEGAIRFIEALDV